MNDELLEYIAELVKEGYTSGMCPTWSIEIEEDEESEEVRLQEIVRLIKEGYTCGMCPSWSLTIISE